MTLLKSDQGMPQDFDVEPPTVADSEPAADTLSRTELFSESISVQKSEDNTDGDMYLYNLQDYETFEPATLADFEWVTYDIAHGILSTGIERMESFEEIEGGWKLYIIDEPNGETAS